jgi:hypothetical protein
MGFYDDADAQIAAQKPKSVYDAADAAVAAAQGGRATVPAGSLYADPAAAAPPKLDKYQQAAADELARNPAIAGRTSGLGGYTQRVGMGIPWSDEMQAAAFTPIEMARHGTLDPREGYGYAKARENLINTKARENTAGVGGTLAELTGALATGAGVLGAGTRTGAVTVPYLNRTIPAGVANYGANVGRAAGFGVVAGAGEGDTLEDRAKHALIGGALGTGLGATLPAVAPAFGVAARFLQMPRLRDPEKIATEQVAKVARDAGVSMDELANRLAAARAAGQSDYTVADALGKEAQRKLAGVAKVPGPARERITDVLTARDLNMPERVGGEVGRKLGAPHTAEEASNALIEQAGANAAPLYRQAERVPTWNETIQRIIEDPIAQQGLRHGVELQRLRSLGTDRPFNPTDAMITGFNQAGDAVITGVPNAQTLHTLKVGLDRMIEGEINPQTRRLTARGQAIDGVRQRLLEQMDTENPMYREARATFAGPMQVNTAVQFGQQMPTHGRAADNIRHFDQMNPPAQQGVRIGYADKVRGDIERTGNFPNILREKSQKGQQELERLSPYGPATLREFLAREEQMQRTSRHALGGPATAENLADMAQTPGGSEALGLAGNVVGGNLMGAVRNAAELAKRVGTGESEAQRSAIARALLANEPDAVAAMQARIAQHELRRRGVNPFVSRPPRYGEGQ